MENKGLKELIRDNQNRKKSLKHPCHLCDYACNRKSYLVKHLVVHGIGERYNCDQCDRAFIQKCNLNEHIRMQHEAVHICHICQKEMANKPSLRYHIQNKHEEKTIPCDECSHMFATVGSLKQHKKGVHVSRSFKCDRCPKRFKSERTLDDHIGSHEIQKEEAKNRLYLMRK